MSGFKDAGARDRRVTIEQLTESLGESSFPVEAWTTLAKCWMEVTPLSGREQFQQHQIQAAADTRFEMPYRADMDPERHNIPKVRRLNYQGRTFDIVSAAQSGRREGIDIMAISRVG